MSVWGAGIGAAVSIGGSLFGASKAKKAKRAADRKAKRLEAEITQLENNRQEIINPYEGVTDLSAMIQDTSGMASNPIMNLSVATSAAEMQAEEADIALANTLDTLAATGASAGGATALAQMALKSKQGVASSIQQQEAANQQLKEQSRVEGEIRLQNIKMSESQRVQQGKMGEAARIQQAGVSGEIFQFQERDKREMQKLNRKSAQLTGQQQASAQAASNQSGALAAGIGAVGNIAGAAFSG